MTTIAVADQLTGGTDVWYAGGGAAPVIAGGVATFNVPATATSMYPAISTLIASKGNGTYGCVNLTGKYTSISFDISSPAGDGGGPTNTSLLFEITSYESTKAQDGSGFRAPFTLSGTKQTVTIMLSTLVPPSFGVGLTQAETIPGFSILADAAAIVIGVPTAGENLDIALSNVIFQ
jgi:hypothetical protein